MTELNELKMSQWPRVIFVTGIDTDSGKSYATGWLAKSMLDAGMSVITQKFIQTGNENYSEDIMTHRSIMDMEPATADKLGYTAPIIFKYPASADLAARLEGKTVDCSVISAATDTLLKFYNHVLIEGAGGLMVPLKGEYLTIDYIKSNKLPVLLTTNSRLGSINHTLLTLNAIKNEGITLFGIIFNHYFDSDKIIAEDTLKYIRDYVSRHFPDAIFIDMPK